MNIRSAQGFSEAGVYPHPATNFPPDSSKQRRAPGSCPCLSGYLHRFRQRTRHGQELPKLEPWVRLSASVYFSSNLLPLSGESGDGGGNPSEIYALHLYSER